MRTVTVAERRRSLVSRHRLRGDATGPDDVAASLVALHATDPATVYLSVLARSHRSSLADVSSAMYERQTLVRWMAMRRTLFVFPTVDVPMIQASISTPLAGRLRRQLLGRLERNGSRPEITGDIGTWLTSVEGEVDESLHRLGSATGAQVSTEVPRLKTVIPARAPSDLPQNVTSPLLTLMSAEGRIVRSSPTGAWTSRHHRWQPQDSWWPDGLPLIEPEEAQRTLARRWLDRFGPATVDDLQWWTGWNKTTVHEVISTLVVEEVDLHGEPGIDLRRSEPEQSDRPSDAPCAALLPTLDPTPMGWTRRDWFLGVDASRIFDRAGNIGPTLWWNGEVVGSWAIAPGGEVRTLIVADRGAEAISAVDRAAQQLEARLDGALVTPAIRTDLERSLL